MGQSLVKNYLHIIFSTKYRQPLIIPQVESELHAYIGGTCKALDCPIIIVGGYVDHIHILCFLSKKITLMELVQKIKANSSKWMKTKHQSLLNFRWQNGYAAFSVNPADMERLVSYIRKQHAHHNKKKFQDEYRETLIEHDMNFDERYLWD